MLPLNTEGTLFCYHSSKNESEQSKVLKPTLEVPDQFPSKWHLIFPEIDKSDQSLVILWNNFISGKLWGVIMCISVKQWFIFTSERQRKCIHLDHTFQQLEKSKNRGKVPSDNSSESSIYLFCVTWWFLFWRQGASVIFKANN